MTFKDRIPNHPAVCKGVKGPEYTADQCRLCWLATYNREYQRKWGLVQPRTLGPIIGPDDYYSCIHRDPEKVNAPGCSGCSGLSNVQRCYSKKTNIEFCAVGVLGQGATTARNYGYRLCAECGFREPDNDLEKPVVELLQLLDQGPGALPENWYEWKSARFAMQTAFLERCSQNLSFPQKKYNGRGIVIGAGGEVYFKCAWVVANLLRELGCFLPIQFWYLGPHEMDPAMVDIARSIGVECIDAARIARSLPVPPRILAGWELKPFSVIHSKFREVLYLDADCLPVRDPSFLFDTAEYLEYGSIFWPDLPPSGKSEWIPPDVWALYGLAYDPTPDFESGQFVVDKSRCWKELQVTMWLNEHSDYVFKHVYGDKSTYHLAWNGCGVGYAMPSTDAGWRSPSILQHDFEGGVLFEHCCQGKNYLANALRVPNLTHSESALAFGKALSMRWSGRMYHPDHPVLPSSFVLQPLNLRVELKPDGTVQGGPPEANRWGWNGSQLALIGKKRVNVQVSDFLTQQGATWIGTKYRLDPP